MPENAFHRVIKNIITPDFAKTIFMDHQIFGFGVRIPQIDYWLSNFCLIEEI